MRGDTLVDDRNHNFFITYNIVIDKYALALGPHAFTVFAYLLRRAGAKKECFPSYKRIAKDLGIGRRTAVNSVDKLIEAGLITKTARTDEHGAASNLYRITDIT